MIFFPEAGLQVADPYPEAAKQAEHTVPAVVYPAVVLSQV